MSNAAPTGLQRDVPPPYWDDRPLYIIGGGSSITDFDFDKLRPLGRLLGCNRSAFYARTDALVTLDQNWVRNDRVEIQRFVDNGGEAYIALPPNHPVVGTIKGPNVHWLYRRRNPGLPKNPCDLYGTNTGYAALCLAWVKRAQDVAMLGYDMGYGADRQTHCHGGYNWHNKRGDRFMANWARDFSLAAAQFDNAGVRVVNFIGEPRSRVEAFQVSSLEDL